MKLSERIESFSELGKTFRDLLTGSNSRYTSAFEVLVNNQQLKNPWFTPENVKMAFKAIANELTDHNLIKWTSRYPELVSAARNQIVGVVMAGNIPLAGFHDFLSVLISGNSLVVKTSTKDMDLIVFVFNILCDHNPLYKKLVTFTEGFLSGFDSVIATGTSNSSRYFEYYFGKYPHIIRKNRNSVAVIDGTETTNELTRLGSDVFSYFGLGCRNVSKIFFPLKYDIRQISLNWSRYASFMNHNKYANNYDYNKAVYMVDREDFIDTGFLLLKENTSISSPVAVLYYSFYNTINEAYQEIENNRDNIQCVVSKKDVPFGMAQSPHLWDYADGIDTIEFLLKKK